MSDTSSTGAITAVSGILAVATGVGGFFLYRRHCHAGVRSKCCNKETDIEIEFDNSPTPAVRPMVEENTYHQYSKNTDATDRVKASERS
jgi:hypothetical protein